MWNDTNTLLLIEEYKKHSCLWDPSDPFFNRVSRKSESWFYLANVMNTSVDEIKRKMASILASFRRERKKEKGSSWFAYKHLTFLLEKFKKAQDKIEEDLTESTEWWTEHDALTDEPDIIAFTSNEDVEESKPDLKLLHENISITAQNSDDNNHEDANSFNDTNTDVANKRQSFLKRSRKIDDFPNHEQSENAKKIRMMTKKCLNINNSTTGENIRSTTSDTNEQGSPPNICQLFSSYVAAKLESYNELRQIVVQHKINEILFQADMGKLDKEYEQ